MAGHYSSHSAPLRAELAGALSREQMRQVHQKSPARHLAIAARQFVMLALATAALMRIDHPAIWILCLVQGFTIFNFTVLLHEVVHRAVFTRPHPRAERLLGWLYAIPSGIAASQFGRWHLDHHAELGSNIDDPKRHHLSPKVNARWFKLLYCSPALFPIYFRAARRESCTYPPDVQRHIQAERRVAIAAHLTVLAAIWWAAGGTAALRAYIVPVFFVFPIAFTLNRLGQHYDIDPTDPAKWTTLMRGHWFWDFWFLNSNYHLEHHYFPGVPFYNLPALQRMLVPFYERQQIPWRGYGHLLKGWLFDNRAPHTNWDLA